MATRRSTKYPTWKQWKAHPFKSWKRAARKIDRGRAEWLKERREIKEDRAKSRLLRDQEIAKKKQAREAKRVAADKARKARMDAAQARRTQQAQPTVRTSPAPAVTTQRRSTPSEAALCGARTDDGTPCQNPTTGGPCSAGHNPKSKPRTKPTVQQQREAANQRDGVVLCKCCGMHHGRAMAKGEHCDWCNGHSRASSAGPRVNTASGNRRIGVQVADVHGGGARPSSAPPSGRSNGGATFNNGPGVRVGQQAQTINGVTNIHMGRKGGG